VLDLSPTKLLIIFVVVVVLLGPKRLPEVARQLGAGWRKLRDLHGQLDRELRQTMPDLPSSQDIVRFARSPITLLNQLADRPGEGQSTSSGSSLASASPTSQEDARVATTTAAAPLDAAAPNRVPLHGGPLPAVTSLVGLDTDDPNLN